MSGSLQNHQMGSRLGDFWLDGEAGRLHPAEQKLLACVAVGEDCNIATTRPSVATEKNTIRATFLRFLLLDGDEQAPVHERGVKVVGGYITCNSSSRWLDLDGTNIKLDFGLLNCVIDGDILLRGARARSISLQGSSVCEIKADRLETSGGLFLRQGFRATGIVRLSSATIGGSLEGDNATFAASDIALHCGRLKVGGSMSLRHGFHANGSVRLMGARIGGDLNCRNGYFNSKENALIAHNVIIGGNVFLDDGFQADGEVDFRNAEIDGNVLCDDVIFSCKNQSLTFNRATIDGMVLLGPNLLSAGQISFSGTKIGRDLSVQGVSLEGRPSLQLRNAEIAGTLTWRKIKHTRGLLDLTGASCRDFSFDEASWKKPKEIKLTNFAYQSFTELPKGADGEFWCDWLARQPTTHLKTKFRPKPFEYLADTLSDMGYDEEALAVRIEKQRRQTDYLQFYQPRPKRPVAKLLHVLGVFWRRAILGPLTDYGYRPGKTGLHLIAVGLIGATIYWWAAHQGIMTPTHPLIYKEAQAKDGLIPVDCAKNWVHMPASCQRAMPSEYSEFHPIWYSADVLLPLVDLRQQMDWAPRVVHVDGSNWLAGRLVRWWEWIEIMAGWLLSLLLVSAIGGFIRR